MAIYSGELTLIGSGTWKAGTTTASVIELGGRQLINFKYSDYFGTYLDLAVKKSAQTTIIATSSNEIMAVVIFGKLYVKDTPSLRVGVGIFLILIGIPLIFALGFGFIVMVLGINSIIDAQILKKDLVKINMTIAQREV